jgi:hypothetical protein
MIIPEATAKTITARTQLKGKLAKQTRNPICVTILFRARKFANQGPREFPALSGPLVALAFIGVSGGCATKRKLEREQTCVWRFPN